ncbi:MAG TPA: RNA-binding cell elongation regulator Jag/EloR [Pseudogracilibacillus sp.]|nr:RNA-binding cell elongation regulator Jag/EloR [Pseudogracilibacillus sp.]
MREATASGETVEEAIESALAQLNLSKEQVEITVIDEGKKGFLGIFGASRAIVKATEVQNNIEKAEQFIKDMTKNMNIETEVETIVSENHVTFNLSGEKIAILIGKRGQTLNAIQYLVQLVINKDSKQYYSVTVDAEGYRNRRKETLESLALKMADKSKRMNRKVALEPMPAFERKIIHNVLQNESDVQTYSDGNDPHRHIVIKP